MIAAGIGFRNNTTGREILAAIDAGIGKFGKSRHDISIIASAGFKSESGILQDVAQTLSVELRLFDQPTLQAYENHTLTVSNQSLAVAGVGSLCEAAALAAMGKNGRLLAARNILGPVTCAFAMGDQR